MRIPFDNLRITPENLTDSLKTAPRTTINFHLPKNYPALSIPARLELLLPQIIASVLPAFQSVPCSVEECLSTLAVQACVMDGMAQANVPLAKLTRMKVELVIATMANFPESPHWAFTQAEMLTGFREVYGDVTLADADELIRAQRTLEQALLSDANFPQSKAVWN